MSGAYNIMQEVGKVFMGKNDIIQKIMLAILAKGHILIEDIPGVGKTTVALAFSKALALQYKRIQFTPDVLPSDIVGFSLYNKQTGVMEYQPGAAMCNLLLADEINRATSRTQSALLEAMEEERITVDGVTRSIPKPFIVIATQNPKGAHGTQLLPDSQLDRFMVRLSIGYPTAKDEFEILKTNRGMSALRAVAQVAGASDVLAMQNEVEEVFVHDKIYSYIIRLITATRDNEFIHQGASPRASVALKRLSQASAYINGRDYVLPQDVCDIFIDCIEHRIILSGKAKEKSLSANTVLKEILETTAAPVVKSVG